MREWVRGRRYVQHRELEREFEACWDRVGGDKHGFATGHLRAIERTIQARGPLLRKGDRGYRRDAAALTDLQMLGKGEYEQGARFSEAITQHIALLPLMALEALRTAMEAPRLVGVNPATLTPDQTIREPNASAVLLEIGEERRDMLAGFGAVLGIDVVTDEGGVISLDELASKLQTHLFGRNQVTRIGGAAIRSLAGLVAVTALTAAVINYGNRLTLTEVSMARKIIEAMYEAHQATIKDEFDRLLQQLRRQVESSLRRYFGIGATQARAFEIGRAIAEVDEARRRLLDALNDPAV